MAILNGLLVNGVSRFLQTVYVKDINVSDQLTVSNLSADHISVGYNHTSYALSANTFICNNWIRTNGATGWFSQTYGGGWYMTDANYIKNYAGKSLLLVSNGGANPSAPSQTGLYLGSTGNYYFRQDGSIRASNFVSPEAKVNTFNATDIVASNSIESPRWIVSSVANLGGRFIVAPTLYFTSSATITVSNITSTTIDLVITDTSSDSPFNGITSENKIAGISWFQGAQVKFSGEINGVGFGSAEGTVLTQMTTSNKRIQLRITTSKGSGLSATSYTGSQIDSIAVMLYKTPVSNNGSTLYPVGIYLSSYGDSRQSFIDIYGGTSENPHARIGQLSGLKDASTNQPIKINGVNADGWGIFTDQGHFTGFINATSGVMGGWTLSDDKIYHTANAPGSTSTVLSPGGVNSTLSIGGSPANTQNAWAFTVKNKFGITTAGKLYCSDADIAGKVAATSGEIGGFEITSSAIKTKDVAVTSNADNSVSLSSSDFTRTVAGASRTNLRFAIGKNFAVTNSGALYASSGILGKWTINTMGLYYSSVTVGSSSIVFVPEGTVSSSTAIGGSSGNKQWVFTVKDYFGIDTSGNMFSKGGKVGGFEIGPSYLVNGTWGNSGSVMMSTGTSGAKAIGGSASTVNGWAFTAGNAFGVTKTGSLYCSDAHVNGEITATSGEIGGWNVINNTIYTNTTDSSGIVTTVALQNSVLDVSTTNCIASANKDSITLTTLEDGAISTQTIVLPVSGTGTYTIELSISRPYYVSGSFVCYYYYGGSIGTSSVSIPSVSGSSGTIISNHTINLPSNIDLTQLTVKSNFSNCLKDDQVIMTFVIKRGSETVLIGWDYVQGTKLPSNIIIGVNKTDSSGSYENPFYLTHSGKIYCENIEAVGGEIAGWKISPSKIYKSVTSSNDETWITGLQSGGSPTNAAFYAGWDGTGNITENSNFWVRNNGYLYSNSGLIAGWKINGSRIECTNTNGYAGLQSANDATSAAFYAGWTGSGNITENSNFWVRHNGTLYAKSGKIGNWDITTSGWFKSTKNSDYIEMSNEWINLYDATDKITTSLNYSGLYIYNNGATKTMQATYAGVALVDGSNLTKMFANSIQTNGYIDFTNSTYGGRLITTSAGNFGLQDKSDSSWVIYCDTANIVHIPLRVVTQNFDGTNRTPIGSTSGSNSEVSHMQSTSGGLNITAKWTSSSLSARALSISSSDIRLKENIKKTDISGLDLINKIDMYSFDWKETHKHQNLGFIADYLEEIDPHLSVGDGGENEDGIPVYKSVDTFYLQGYEVRAIQELSKENEELKKRISRLEEIINGR